LKNILKESKFVSLLYLIGGLLIVGVGFFTKQDFFLTMGVIVVLLGTIVSLSLKVSHLIHLIKRAGLWDPNMPQICHKN
jgi:NADH:ubiquinone oxidoreductase subunit 6 (subunit J)